MVFQDVIFEYADDRLGISSVSCCVYLDIIDRMYSQEEFFESRTKFDHGVEMRILFQKNTVQGIHLGNFAIFHQSLGKLRCIQRDEAGVLFDQYGASLQDGQVEIQHQDQFTKINQFLFSCGCNLLSVLEVSIEVGWSTVPI